jgi:hypothetical protein
MLRYKFRLFIGDNDAFFSLRFQHTLLQQLIVATHRESDGFVASELNLIGVIFPLHARGKCS